MKSSAPPDVSKRALQAPFAGAPAAASLQKVYDGSITVKLQQDLGESWADTATSVPCDYRRHTMRNNDKLEKTAADFAIYAQLKHKTIESVPSGACVKS